MAAGALNGQRRVAIARHLDRAELWLGADVPVEVLHALDHAGAGHLGEIPFEFPPAQREGRTADSGKANTEFSRAERTRVSCPCTNGDEADSAMKCGM